MTTTYGSVMRYRENDKMWYYPASHPINVNVLLTNITFTIFAVLDLSIGPISVHPATCCLKINSFFRMYNKTTLSAN